MKALSFVNFVLFILVISLLVFLNTNIYSILFYIILYLILKINNVGILKKIREFSFLYFSFMGLLAVFSYLFFCGESFSPYADDSYYFSNIETILNDFYCPGSTIYEYIVAAFVFPLSFFKKITPTDTLFFNWFIGSIVVYLSLKFSHEFFPFTSNKIVIFSALLILFNFNFIIGTVHLYRDILMCFFMILSFVYCVKRKLKKTVIYAILTGFVRGANGILTLLFGFLYFWKNLSKSNIIKFVLGLFVLFILSDSFIGYSAYLRSFNKNDSDNRGISQRIMERQEFFVESGEASGVLKMLQSNNIVIKLSVLPIYMLSPFKVGELVRTEKYEKYNEKSFIVTRVKIELLWEIISVYFYSFFIIPLFYGCYYIARYGTSKEFIVLVILLICLASVAYISMQHRHKMAFILFYPFIYNAFCKYSKFSKANLRIATLSTFFLILIYNFFK